MYSILNPLIFQGKSAFSAFCHAKKCQNHPDDQFPVFLAPEFMDAMEVLAAGEENRVFTAEWIRNEEGELIERSSHPMDMVVLPAPFAVSEEDIIRRAYDH